MVRRGLLTQGGQRNPAQRRVIVVGVRPRAPRPVAHIAVEAAFAEAQRRPAPRGMSLAEFGIAPAVVAVLAQRGIHEPTDIQVRAMPDALAPAMCWVGRRPARARRWPSACRLPASSTPPRRAASALGTTVGPSTCGPPHPNHPPDDQPRPPTTIPRGAAPNGTNGFCRDCLAVSGLGSGWRVSTHGH